ncbi:MAG TPA: TerC/Alx family metal homeostasis membrane protein [Rhabdochlamydiaceae bacterium]|jgi:tellurite resistance protein TerC|nr:TerC/Alx family metal homeostasis membrane protein [Rhabdochlamydiaceae bacterium]
MARWVGFHLLVLLLLVIDLLIYRKKEMKQKAALISSVAGVVVALLFNGYVFLQMGSQKGIEFFTSYIVEKSLSIDNLFVFLMIFSYFKVPRLLQHKALYFGVVGAFVLRLGLILGGVALINRFDWVTYFLGAIIGYTGVVLMLEKKEELLEENGILRWIRRHFKVTAEYVEDQLIVKRKGIKYLTPLFLVMVMIETSDVLFALDSVPAVLAITKDSFIAYTSNVLAVLGLRSLFFLMEPWFSLLSRLKIGLGAILVFIGAKMLISFVIHIPLLVSLAVIATILGISILYSVLRMRNQ